MDERLIMRKVKRGRKSKSENEEKKDWISDMPECILLHIFTFMKVKDAVRTCILSTRWKDLWKRLPFLILLSSDFPTLKSFTKFVSRVLTLRDSSTALNSLEFRRSGFIQPQLLKRIVNYAISHNVQRLGLSVTTSGIEHFPRCIISCKTLTSLKLAVQCKNYSEKTLLPKSLDLPALTKLHLENFAFCANGNDHRAEPFSSFNRLNSLIVVSCSLSDDANILCISSSTLCNLTIFCFMDLYKIELSSPSLRTFVFVGPTIETLSGRNLSSIERVIFDIHISEEKYFSTLLSWLLDLRNIKSLTVTTRTLEVLSLIPGLLELKYPILGSLNSLKVIVRGYQLQNEPAMLEDRFSPIVDFLLQNSPSADVGFIIRGSS